MLLRPAIQLVPASTLTDLAYAGLDCAFRGVWWHKAWRVVCTALDVCAEIVEAVQDVFCGVGLGVTGAVFEIGAVEDGLWDFSVVNGRVWMDVRDSGCYVLMK